MECTRPPTIMSRRTVNIYFISPASILFPSYGLLRRLLRYRPDRGCMDGRGNVWGWGCSVGVCHFELRAYLPSSKLRNSLSPYQFHGASPINWTGSPSIIVHSRPLVLDPFQKDSLLEDFISEINTPSLFYFTQARTRISTCVLDEDLVGFRYVASAVRTGGGGNCAARECGIYNFPHTH